MDEARVRDLSDIECRYSIDHENDERVRILIAKFDGVYRYGSEGNTDAAFIKAESVRGLAAFDPDGFILDFSGLDYRWGNSLLGVFQIVDELMNEKDEPPFPLFVVTSDKCRDALLSLTGRVEDESDWHFRDLEKALQEARRAARAWLYDN